MKITLIGSAHPFRGGLAAFNERLTQQFNAEKDEAQVYTFSLQYPNFLFPGKSQYTDEPAPADLSITIAVNSINPFNWWRVGQLLRQQKADILLFKFWLPFMAPCFGSIARLVRRNQHTRIIAILDNVIPHEHRPGDRLLTQYFVNSCDAFIAMSQEVLNDLRQFDAHKPARLVPHPIYDNFGNSIAQSQAQQQLGLATDKQYVLFFGLIRAYKGLDLLLEAMSDARLVERNIHLIVAGEFYEDRSPYDKLIAQYQLQDRLLLVPDFIPNAAVHRYFCAADVVVQPYKTATQSGISQMAYHFDKPMIVTNVGGLPEMVPNGKVGYVTEPTATAIADAIVTYFDQNRQAEFVANVQTEKKRYAWANMTQAIRELSKPFQKVQS
jgi:D-inositol-3-phosphate glycosyltransferase